MVANDARNKKLLDSSQIFAILAGAVDYPQSCFGHGRNKVQRKELIDRIKAITDVPVAVLTNGSLLWDQAVRAQLINADLIITTAAIVSGVN